MLFLLGGRRSSPLLLCLYDPCIHYSSVALSFDGPSASGGKKAATPFQKPVGAVRIDPAATPAQGKSDLLQVRDACRVPIRQCRELAAQQRQPEHVSKKDPLLLDQTTAVNEPVEVPSQIQEVPGRPDGPDLQLGDLGQPPIKDKPQFRCKGQSCSRFEELLPECCLRPPGKAPASQLGIEQSLL